MSTPDLSHDLTEEDSAGDGDEQSVVLQGYGLKRYYPVTGGPLKRKIGDVKAVDGVDLRIEEGETFGLVGESGCGKSTLARVLVGLDDPTAGRLYFDMPASAAEEVDRLERRLAAGESLSADEEERLSELRAEYDLSEYSKARRKEFRRNVQFVFQNPTSSLNPRQLIRDIVSRPLKLHTDLNTTEREERVIDLLEVVGLGEDFLYRYPHMLSGGQCQRVAIARAVATNPEFIVLDEPTSALDVSVQAQILNLLEDLQEEFGLTYLFISHDLGVVRHMADEIAVMYLGQVVERASREAIFSAQKHPYTEALLSSSPAIETDDDIRLAGDVPDPENPPAGCRFHTRCHRAEAFCGWNPDDVVDLLEQVAPTDEEVDRLYQSLSDVETDGFTGTFTFERGADADRAAAALAGENTLLRDHRPVLFEAVQDVDRDGNAVTVEFQQVDVPPLEPDEPDHHVACYLYD